METYTGTNTGTDRNKRGYILLSLDGGGIRGLSELIIIEELMQRLKYKEKLDQVPIPADRFDLIGGTSTGGLIAILLGRLRLSAADAIRAYEALAGKVFSEQKSKGKDGTFKASKLEEAIKDVIKGTLGDKHTNAKMYNEGKGGSDKCRAFVCAVGTSDITHAAGPTLFRSYDVAKNKEYNCTIWEAARATSAAPTFFKRIKIGPSGSGIEYVDAGIGCNNPVKQVIAEAARVFGEDARIAGIVSIGTGQSGSVGLARPDAFQKWLPTDLVRVLREIATDSGRVAEEMESKYSKAPGLYTRLDVDRGLQTVSLDEWKRLGVVRSHTKNYMRLEINDKRVDNVVELLSGSSSHGAYRAVELVGPIKHKAHTTLIINVPHSRVSHFVDRPTMLAGISDRFLNSTSQEPLVLLGMGGSGKTQLALEFCRQAEENLGFMAVIWINASSPISVMQSYKVIAKKISKSQQDDADSESLISLVQDTLRDWKHPWLFVFDNFDDPQAFQASSIRHYIPSGKEGRILFTSRHRHLERLGQEIAVSEMTEDESLKILLQRLPLDDEERFHGKKIAATLGYLALALDQAGSYLRTHNVPLCDFISRYHKRKEAILKEIPDEWEYRSSSDKEKETYRKVFTTWELSFEQIEQNIQEKEHFLTLAAFFNITAISERYFEAYFNAEKPEWMSIFTLEGEWDSDKLGDVLAEFYKLSLLQKPKHAVRQQMFSIHPVVRDWIQIRKSRETQQQFVEEFITMLEIYLADTDYVSMSLGTKQETLLHLDSCIEHNMELQSGSSDWRLDHRGSAALSFADFYSNEHRYEEAERLYKRVLTNQEKNPGATYPDPLRTVHNLAILCAEQGRYNEAEKLYKRVLINREEKLGATHPDTLRTVHNFAILCAEQGRYNEAERLYKRVLTDREEKLGVTHPDTLRTVHDFANLCAEQGRQAEAEKLYKRVLIDQEKKLGVKHFDTLHTMSNLATLYREQGRFDKAERLLEEVLAGQKEISGVRHPIILWSMGNLAGVYQKQGRFDEAERLFEQALAGQKETLGAKHSDTLDTMRDLAWCIQDRAQGRFDEVEKLFKELLIGQKETLGAKHSDTLDTMRDLADVYRDQGRFDEAEMLLEEVLAGQKEILGVKHPDTLRTSKKLARCIRERDEMIRKAKQLPQQALAGEKRTQRLRYAS